MLFYKKFIKIMDKLLRDVDICITRPTQQNVNLCRILDEHGAKPYTFPTIEIIAKSSATLKKLIEDLPEFNLLIFTSANAVTHCAALIKHTWPTLPVGIKIAAIGKSTKNAIEAQGWTCDISPEIDYSSAGLLATEALRSMSKQTVLILTGKDGLNDLTTTLRQRGNNVKIGICYQRIVPKYSASAIIELVKNKFDFIVCTSNDSLNNFALILGTQTIKKFRETQIIAFSSRINALAKSLGFIKEPIITTMASDEAIVETIIKYKGRTMTEKNKAHESKEKEQPAKSPAKSEIPSKNIDTPKPIVLMSLVAIIFSLLALVEGAYLNHKTKTAHHAVTESSEQLKIAINNQNQQLAMVANQLKQLQSNINNNALKLNATQMALHALKDVKFMDNTRWSLAEIKYLLTMAQYNLTITPAPDTALAILEKVNGQLKQLDNPTTLPLRQQVLIAITQLKSLPSIDYAGTLMQLNAVSNQLNTMPLFINSQNGEKQNFAPTAESKGWRKYWNASLQTLEKLVVVRHQNSSAEPLITPKEQMFLEENIQAKLSQASWALLQHNQAVYNLSLQEAINWIQTYYTPNDAATVSIINTLQSLMKVNFSLQLPDLTSTLLLTQQLLEQPNGFQTLNKPTINQPTVNQKGAK